MKQRLQTLQRWCLAISLTPYRCAFAAQPLPRALKLLMLTLPISPRNNAAPPSNHQSFSRLALAVQHSAVPAAPSAQRRCMQLQGIANGRRPTRGEVSPRVLFRPRRTRVRSSRCGNTGDSPMSERVYDFPYEHILVDMLAGNVLRACSHLRSCGRGDFQGVEFAPPLSKLEVWDYTAGAQTHGQMRMMSRPMTDRYA